MGYFKALGLSKEPFSTSPDPAFFYRSAAHVSALQRLEINVRLRRGLSLVLGDVGTGKTTLGRVLTQTLQTDKKIELHLILNPLYQSEFQFLEALCRLFQVSAPLRSSMDCLEALQNHLFRAGAEKNKIIVLLIDEGQNLGPSLIEVLRSLLNYETNEFKLLQLVIMAQMEALPRFQRIRNFMDRVSLKYVMNPFDEEETRRMIHHRLKQAGAASPERLFTDGAIHLIHDRAQGYPRRVTALCHNALESLIMLNKPAADETVVRALLAEEDRKDPAKTRSREVLHEN